MAYSYSTISLKYKDNVPETDIKLVKELMNILGHVESKDGGWESAADSYCGELMDTCGYSYIIYDEYNEFKDYTPDFDLFRILNFLVEDIIVHYESEEWNRITEYCRKSECLMSFSAQKCFCRELDFCKGDGIVYQAIHAESDIDVQITRNQIDELIGKIKSNASEELLELINSRMNVVDFADVEPGDDYPDEWEEIEIAFIKRMKKSTKKR